MSVSIQLDEGEGLPLVGMLRARMATPVPWTSKPRLRCTCPLRFAVVAAVVLLVAITVAFWAIIGGTVTLLIIMTIVGDSGFAPHLPWIPGILGASGIVLILSMIFGAIIAWILNSKCKKTTVTV